MSRLSKRYGRARAKKDVWSSLSGGYDKAARSVAGAVKELEHANEVARDSVARAKAAWRPDWARPAKDAVSDGFNAVQKALQNADNTLGSSGTIVDRLPAYGDPSHVNQQARAMLVRLVGLSASARATKALLSRALTGEPEKVKAALDQIVL